MQLTLGPLLAQAGDNAVVNGRHVCIPDGKIVFAVREHWYGQGTFFEQHWPLSASRIALDPFQTADGGRNLQGPQWITSTGVALAAPGYQDLACEWRDGEFELRTRSGGELWLWHAVTADAKQAAQALIAYAGLPQARPRAEVFAQPIWTTWAEFKLEINQELVLDYAREIVHHGFPRSVMEIDAKWQRVYGDTSYDPQRFPDPKAMVDELHSLGFAVTSWVPWFVDEGSEHFEAPDEMFHDRGRLIGWFLNKEVGGKLLDCSNPAAVAWFAGQLQGLCNRTGMDGFKFDAGEASMFDGNRNDFSDVWASMALRFPFTEARASWWGQKLGVLMRQFDKLTEWGIGDGLATVVGQALNMSLIGYPFVVPDMIGGNEYGNECTPELMVRWAQACALLPVAQFSVKPWQWDDHTTQRVLATTHLRTEHAARLDALADEAVATGSPIVRPMFWLSPGDDRALLCGDQYALGNDVLVAPVTIEGATSRDVLLPPGTWRDARSGDRLAGNRVLEAYDAPIDVLPLFLRDE